MDRELKCECGFKTSNKKSFSNHIRFGCKVSRPEGYTDIKCKYCGSLLVNIKPSKQGVYCNRNCYTADRNGKLRGSYGTRVVEISGYLYDYSPFHPNCTKTGYVAQHRIIAEKNR